MVNVEKFRAHLEWAEDRRPKPYRDSVGKLTIGVGRNLEDRGLRDDEIDYLLDNDIADTLVECTSFPFWPLLDEVRQMVVADMLFNMGRKKFDTFARLQAALMDGDYERAADEMIDSRWFGQVGRRAVRLEKAMRTGQWTH